jgi:hypothetical protein
MTKTLGQAIVWIFEFLSLGFVCYLEFVIWNFGNMLHIQKSESSIKITKACLVSYDIFSYRSIFK